MFVGHVLFAFAVALSADAIGVDAVLTQYGFDDTMLDLVFDLFGGLVVALWGGAYLADVSGAIRDHLDGRTDRR